MKNIKTLDLRQKMYLIAALLLLYGSVQLLSCSMSAYCSMHGSIGQNIAYAIEIKSDTQGSGNWAGPRLGDDKIQVQSEAFANPAPPPPAPWNSH